MSKIGRKLTSLRFVESESIPGYKKVYQNCMGYKTTYSLSNSDIVVPLRDSNGDLFCTFNGKETKFSKNMSFLGIKIEKMKSYIKIPGLNSNFRTRTIRTIHHRISLK